MYAILADNLLNKNTIIDNNFVILINNIKNAQSRKNLEDLLFIILSTFYFLLIL